MKAAFFLGTALMMASASWGSEEYPKLVLRVYDFSGIRISDLTGALAETARIYRAAGIELIWTEADPAGPATVQSVVVASIVSSAGPDLPVGVLGRAFPFGVSGNRITLFLDNIRVRAKQASLPFPILLGHALAHELGHVMLGAGAGDHRFPGLMCAEWGPMEFDRIRHGALKFSHSHAVAMRRTLTERLRADPSGTVGSLLEPWLLVASAVGDAVVQSVGRHVPASPACVELNQTVMTQIANGQLTKAEVAVSAVLVSRGDHGQDSCAGLILNNMATSMSVAGRIADAERLAQRSVQILEKTYSPDDLEPIFPYRGFHHDSITTASRLAPATAYKVAP